MQEAYPGNTLAKIHSLSVQLLSEGLRDLGILPGASLDDIMRGLYRCVSGSNTAGSQRALSTATCRHKSMRAIWVL